MKTYIKKQYTGNENGWAEPIAEVSQHTITDEQAALFNEQFRNTGIKYEIAAVAPPKVQPKAEEPKV